ncbi:P1 family peptidase [Aquabacter sp. L1I39]|uniref:P1 family peptidase n=1 Tax=Aquabacter sp. L1I39 TaxID=2820278 RepID=UPI001AD9774B|nr:P1 family peptidase [Aquabacter sp. L1I39]QTL01770.1 P1 family peptidase [Aquabacter sp. L1I39]
MLNLITDVRGLRVGHAQDLALGSGCTVVLCDAPAVASVDVRGGSPGTRETDLLAPAAVVEKIDAIVLSGGSAFGLDAASGVMAALASQGRGFAVGAARVPIVPSAILFDLLNGGEKAWGDMPPYRALGIEALARAADGPFALGSVGAGTGAQTATVKGGLGSASARAPSGHVVGALVAVNAFGNPLVGDGPWLRAAPYERNAEFGGRGLPAPWPDETAPRIKGFGTRANTTIAVIATDAALSVAQARRLAVMAQDGFALGLHPAHAPQDGDCVFALATARSAAPVTLVEETLLGATAAHVMARAIGRAVYEATTLPFPGAQKAWRDLFD